MRNDTPAETPGERIFSERISSIVSTRFKSCWSVYLEINRLHVIAQEVLQLLHSPAGLEQYNYDTSLGGV